MKVDHDIPMNGSYRSPPHTAALSSASLPQQLRRQLNEQKLDRDPECQVMKTKINC
jgi:hypothetical protein